MVGILFCYWGGLFSGAMLVAGRVSTQDNLFSFTSFLFTELHCWCIFIACCQAQLEPLKIHLDHTGARLKSLVWLWIKIIGPKKFAPRCIAAAATAQTYERWDCANLCHLKFRILTLSQLVKFVPKRSISKIRFFFQPKSVSESWFLCIANKTINWVVVSNMFLFTPILGVSWSSLTLAYF